MICLSEWQLGAPEADARVRLTFALVEQNMGKLTAMALEISDPTSPSYSPRDIVCHDAFRRESLLSAIVGRYSKYLTRAEIEALTAPPASTVKAVEEWIRAHTDSARLLS